MCDGPTATVSDSGPRHQAGDAEILVLRDARSHAPASPRRTFTAILSSSSSADVSIAHIAAFVERTFVSPRSSLSQVRADTTLVRRHHKCCRAEIQLCQFPAFSISDPRPPRPFADTLIRAWLYVHLVSSRYDAERCFPFIAACSYRRQRSSTYTYLSIPGVPRPQRRVCSPHNGLCLDVSTVQGQRGAFWVASVTQPRHARALRRGDPSICLPIPIDTHGDCTPH